AYVENMELTLAAPGLHTVQVTCSNGVSADAVHEVQVWDGNFAEGDYAMLDAANNLVAIDGSVNFASAAAFTERRRRIKKC
ncbi:MAG: hypothetical protein GY822_26870, partial [Deltaproteobacteria bacterium]|nr:hypothetical protein [Deltaproteobacteria bacterium]